MAILSNINGKFAVESSGAIQLSGSAGTSGYVLKSNGTGSAASWVDPTTIIGGPYLPLSGGTLTGATATASNIAFTVGGTFTVTGKFQTTSTGAQVTGSTFTVYHPSSATKLQFIQTNGNWKIEAGGGTNKLVFHSESLVEDYLTIKGGGQIQLNDYGSGSHTGTTAYTLAVDSSGNIIETTDGGGDITGSGTTNTVAKFTGAKAIGNGPVTFSGNNSTFAGDVMPAAENAHNIGSASLRWEDLYVDDGFIRDAYIDTNIYHNGDTDTYINFTTDTIKLATAGGFGFELDSNRDINSPDRLYMRQTRFGYSSAYKVVQFGNAASTSAISLGYNPSSNTNGGFSGNEILIPNNIRILAPNAADNQFYGVMMFDSNNKLLIGSSNYLIDSNYIMAMDPATQRVGIGTNSPTAKLEIVGSNGTNIFRGNFGGSADIFMGFDNANPYLLLQDNSNVTTHLFQSNVNNYIVGSNVGIGNTSPQTQLQVTSNTTTKLRVNTTGVADSMVEILGYDAGLHIGDNTNGNRWAIWNDGPGTSTSLNFGSYALGTWYVPASQVMTMTSGGNVGIGTTSPNTKLSLEDSTVDSAVQISFKNDAREWRWGVNGGMSDAINLYDNTAGYTRFYVSPNGWSYFNNATTGGGIEIYGTGGNYVDFYVTASNTLFSTNASNGFYFNSNVGLGTTTPTHALTVEGNGKGIDLRGGNNRIYFTGYRALEGATNGSTLQVGEGYTSTKIDSTYCGVNVSPSGFAALEIENSFSTSYSLYADYTDTNGSYGVMKIILTGASTSPSYVDWWYGATQTGSVVTTGSSTQYLTSSDYRLKENIVPMSNAIDRVKQLKPSRFNFIGHENTVDGLIAHEVADVVPEAVNGEKDGLRDDGTPKYQGIDEGKLVPLLIGAIQELEARVKELENK